MLQNLKNYIGALNLAKKVILLMMIGFFSVAGASFSYIIYGLVKPSSTSSAVTSSTKISPLDFFGKASSQKVETPQTERTVESPLNGLMYSTSEAKEWQARRPMAVMVNNHVDARSQWGLSYADIVYEAVAEGGISRFLAIYHSKLPDKVGPVRSARKYYVDWAKEYDAWYAHWGGASTANEANVYDYMRTIYVSSIDVPSIGPNEPFDRDPERLKQVAIEHTGYARLPLVYEAAYRMYSDQVREFRPISAWKFKEDAVEDKRPAMSSAEFNFWDLTDFIVKWEYDPKTNTYIRHQGGKVQVDALTNESLRAKNVVIQFMQETSLMDEKAHLLYKTIGRGTAKILLDGKVMDATWERKDLATRTRYFDTSGLEIVFNRGLTWIEVLPIGNTITYN